MYLWLFIIAFIIAVILLIRFVRKGGLILLKKRHLTAKSIMIPEHYWEEADQTGFYYCCICQEVGGNLFNKRLFECLICGALRHSSCLVDEKIPCKAMTYGSSTLFNSHQWVKGNLPLNCICDICGMVCGSIYGLEASRCMWCHQVVHENCMQKAHETCDFGHLADAIIRPSQVKVSKETSPSNNTITTSKSDLKSNLKSKLKSKIKEAEQELVSPKYTISGGTKMPIVAIVNKRSGGQMGAKVLSSFYNHLNPIQVIDLIDEGLDRLNDFTHLDNLKLIVGGGDGTISLVIDKIKRDIQTSSEKNSKFKVPIAILPLGTGNDLSRSLGWGPGATMPDVKSVILDVLHHSEPVLLDRWTVTIEHLTKGKVDKVVRNSMLNYLGVGLDAKIALQFHKMREKYPYLFKSRFGNKLIYTQMGTMDFFFGKPQNISKLVSLTCDGESIPLSGLQGLVILNIDYWGGGVHNIWGDLVKEEDIPVQESSYSEAQSVSDGKEKVILKRDFRKQSICDGIMEVIGLQSVFHMGQSQAGLAKGIRICQGSKIELSVTKRGVLFPMQIDGEPTEITSPFKITLENPEKVNMLTKTSYKKLKNESKIVKVLDLAEASNQITAQQREYLLDALIKELSK